MWWRLWWGVVESADTLTEIMLQTQKIVIPVNFDESHAMLLH
jgi:hypothetical protein